MCLTFIVPIRNSVLINLACTVLAYDYYRFHYGPCIFWSLDFLFNIESRKMRNGSFFVFKFFAKNEKQEFGLICSFSFRGRKMNKQLEYSISTRGRELNSPFCWLVRQKKRSNHAVISPSAVPRSRILVLCCSSSCTDS